MEEQARGIIGSTFTRTEYRVGPDTEAPKEGEPYVVGIYVVAGFARILVMFDPRQKIMYYAEEQF
jgi:hypothetical protein